jgi:hypothetical protein
VFNVELGTDSVINSGISIFEEVESGATVFGLKVLE